MAIASKFSEVSVYVGGFLSMIGVGVWVGQFYLQMFTSWGWAILIGSLLFVLGYLFLFNDIRVYVGEQTVTEALITENVDQRKSES